LARHRVGRRLISGFSRIFNLLECENGSSAAGFVKGWNYGTDGLKVGTGAHNAGDRRLAMPADEGGSDKRGARADPAEDGVV
jgi:hypothetical protein